MQLRSVEMPKGANLIGQQFGRLTVVAYAGRNKQGSSTWDCLCQCGGSTKTTTRCLRSGDSRSCGCLRKEKVSRLKVSHGMSRSPEYYAYIHMIDRCTNPNNKSYHNYGGRGVTVCDKWLASFASFYADMGDRPKGGSLERINVNQGYCPSNCKWAEDWGEQARNKRRSVLVTHNGETKCATEWARDLGVPKSTALARLQRGLPFEQVFARRAA